MRIQHVVNVFASDDTEGACVLWGVEDPTKNTEIIDSFLLIASGKINIVGSATESVPFGDVPAADVRGVQVTLDGDFNAVFNGGVDTILFKLADAQTGRKARLFMEAALTSVAITNPGTADLNGTYVVWGKAVTP